MAPVMTNGPPENRHSTELFFEAPRTPHDHYNPLENVQDVEGDTLGVDEWLLDEPNQVNRLQLRWTEIQTQPHTRRRGRCRIAPQ